MQEKTMKEIYETPLIEVSELEAEGVICLSGEVGATMNGIWGEEEI